MADILFHCLDDVEKPFLISISKGEHYSLFRSYGNNWFKLQRSFLKNNQF